MHRASTLAIALPVHRIRRWNRVHGRPELSAPAQKLIPDPPSSEDPLKDDYQAALRELQPGDAGEIELGSLPPEVLKAGMEAAAGDLGYELRWGTPVAPNMLRFQVVRPETPRPNGKATSGGSPPTDGDIARIRQQIETWRERLIDLTQRNP